MDGYTPIRLIEQPRGCCCSCGCRPPTALEEAQAEDARAKALARLRETDKRIRPPLLPPA